MTVSGRAGWFGVCWFVVALAAGRSAMAQVVQTDAIKTPLPQPVGLNELNLVNQSWMWNSATQILIDASGAPLSAPVAYGDYYKPPAYPQFVTGDAITLSGLFKWRHEALDPIKDAKTGPGYFSAKCGFNGQPLLQGGNCQMKFGWYNVLDPNSKTPPSAAEIYPFINEPASALSCTQGDGVTPKIDGFCPLAWDNRGPNDLSKKRWLPQAFSSGDLTKDPRYKGGFVAFALIGTAANAQCPQTKFSMYEHNQRNAQGAPWVTSLSYESTVDAGGFYLAFEDLPMPAAGWKTGGLNGGADGDFNDYVVYVSGLSCTGGNQACSTGLFGQCSRGRTTCAAEGEASSCRPTTQKSAEVCDNVDNDCDGFVDNGSGLCADPNKPNCFRGTCLANCNIAGVTCPASSTCNASGQCVDACTPVNCAAGSICRNGACVGDPCAGVLCESGKRCELGRCIDACAGVTCSGNRVCDQGLCVDNCSCAGCSNGLSCGASGRCVDSSCVGKSCPTGQTCQLGACIDPCAGVVCPGNAGVCVAGSCVLPGMGGHGGMSSGGASPAEAGSDDGAEAGAGDATASGGADGGHDSAGHGNASAGASASAGATAAGGDESHSAPPAAASSSSCAYAAPGRSTPERALSWLGVAFAAAVMRRRSRRLARSQRS